MTKKQMAKGYLSQSEGLQGLAEYLMKASDEPFFDKLVPENTIFYMVFVHTVVEAACAAAALYEQNAVMDKRDELREAYTLAAKALDDAEEHCANLSPVFAKKYAQEQVRDARKTFEEAKANLAEYAAEQRKDGISND